MVVPINSPKPDDVGANASVRIIASQGSWIVGDAVTQLKRVAQLPGVVRVVGMPDLHPGRGVPVGAVAVTQGMFYPHLVGNDIGCGMSLWQTDLPCRKLKVDRWVRKLGALEGDWDGDFKLLLAEAGIAPTLHDRALGTIGGGNHFAELQIVNEVCEPASLETIGLRTDHLLLLVHSGSRGLGESVLRQHVDRFGSAGLPEGSEEAREYLGRHGHALAWAQLNRRIIAWRFLAAVGGEGRGLLDLSHNSVTSSPGDGQSFWLHRKGAAPSGGGMVIVPGSRGTLSYLVRPLGDQSPNGFSIAHGAGRRWTRTDARSRLERKYSVEDLQRTDLGGRVVCDDKDLLYEEAPQAYKDVDRVVQDLVQPGIVAVVATTRPVLTYKIKVTEA